jgi:hypothetical protein
VTLSLSGIVRGVRDQWIASLIVVTALGAGWTARGHLGKQIMLPFTNAETLGRLVPRVDSTVGRMSAVEARQAVTEARVSGTDAVLSRIDRKLDSALAGIAQVKLEACLDRANTPEDRRRCARGGS